MLKQTYNKILIVGDAGRGKTALAQKISKKLGLPHYSTDDSLYEIKYTIFKDRQKGLNEMAEIYRSNKWVVEGTTRYLLNGGMDAADIIIHLKYKSIFSQIFNLLKRHFVRKDKSLWQSLLLMRHVIYKRFQTKKSRQEMKQMTISEHILPHMHKSIVLTSFKEIDEFIDSI